MSTFRVEIVPVELLPCPNADSLSIVQVFGENGYQVVVRTDDWRAVDRGAYIPPDSVVPDTPAYVFLAPPGKALRDKDRRITVRRFRGQWSHGLLVPAPAGAAIGENVAESLEIIHYEPPPRGPGTSGESEPPPSGARPTYDLEHHRRFSQAMLPSEEVVITEKIHGVNARFTFQDGRMYCGSRREWLCESDMTVWWLMLRQYPQIEQLCREHPGLTLYGEIYGALQDLTYGLDKGRFAFAAFDLHRGAETGQAGFVNFDKAYALCARFSVPWAPILYRGPYAPDLVKRFVDGPSMVPGAAHMREGCVIRPVIDREDAQIGRVHLKLVSDEYLSRT